MAFMKQYQQLWLDKLNVGTNKQIDKTIDSIIGDDTGTTDALTQKLAKMLRDERAFSSLHGRDIT